jgi:hypothetical protein
MARKPDDIFIIGAESPGEEEPERQDQAEPGDPFAPRPEDERPLRRRRLTRPPTVVYAGAIATGLAVFAVGRLGGASNRSPSAIPIASPPRVASTAPAPDKAHLALSLPREAASGARRRRSRARHRRVRRGGESAVPRSVASEAAAPLAPTRPPAPAPSEDAPAAASPPSAYPALPARPEFGFER